MTIDIADGTIIANDVMQIDTDLEAIIGFDPLNTVNIDTFNQDTFTTSVADLQIMLDARIASVETDGLVLEGLVSLDLLGASFTESNRFVFIGGFTGIESDTLAASLDSLALGFSGSVSEGGDTCLLYTSPSPRDKRQSRMPSSA